MATKPPTGNQVAFNLQTAMTSLQWAVNRVIAPMLLIYLASVTARFSPKFTSSWMFALFMAVGLVGLLTAIKPSININASFSVASLVLVAYLAPGMRWSEVIGAYMIGGLLVVAIAFVGPRLGKIQPYLPPEVFLGALAGVFLQLEMRIFPSFSKAPLLIGVVLLAYVGAKRLTKGKVPPLPLAMVAGIILALVLYTPRKFSLPLEITVPQLLLFNAKYQWAKVISLAIPLALAALGAFNPGKPGLTPMATKPVFINGLVFLVTGIFGGHGVTAGVGGGKEGGPVLTRYLPHGIMIAAALLSTTLLATLRWFPLPLIQVLVAVILIPLFMQSLITSLSKGSKIAAFLALVISASSVSWLGINSFIWALIAGFIAAHLSEKQ